jgi:hypothetical protein
MRYQSGFGSRGPPDAGDHFGGRAQRSTDHGAGEGPDAVDPSAEHGAGRGAEGSPQISKSRTRPERPRLRRSGFP